jgi:hypothetical protein
MNAAQLIDALAEHGARLALVGDRVTLRHPAGKPIPATLVEAARAHKAELRTMAERGVTGEATAQTSNYPVEWREGFARLSRHRGGAAFGPIAKNADQVNELRVVTAGSNAKLFVNGTLFKELKGHPPKDGSLVGLLACVGMPSFSSRLGEDRRLTSAAAWHGTACLALLAILVPRGLGIGPPVGSQQSWRKLPSSRYRLAPPQVVAVTVVVPLLPMATPAN